MNKKIIFTCVVLVMLVLITTACKLPAAGSPPPVTTQVPEVPTATTGVAAELTNTSVPPTPVVVTVTSAPPTPVPPTPVLATPVPPTPTPLPQAIRIQFAAGGTSAVINGEMEAEQTLYYVLGASATQTMSVKVTSPNSDVYLGVFGADSQVFLTNSTQDTLWSGTLPTTQDYFISLTASNGKTNYSLTVDIPPLQTIPTPNITPVAGTFDPVVTYGNPTFDDPMTGGEYQRLDQPGLRAAPKYQLH